MNEPGTLLDSIVRGCWIEGIERGFSGPKFRSMELEFRAHILRNIFVNDSTQKYLGHVKLVGVDEKCSDDLERAVFCPLDSCQWSPNRQGRPDTRKRLEV